MHTEGPPKTPKDSKITPESEGTIGSNQSVDVIPAHPGENSGFGDYYGAYIPGVDGPIHCHPRFSADDSGYLNDD
jgi:hypothetical protein